MAKVMVVDDAVSELKLMESILKSAGHEVVSLVDGEALVDKLSSERPDVLLLSIVARGGEAQELRGVDFVVREQGVGGQLEDVEPARNLGAHDVAIVPVGRPRPRADHLR